MRLRPLRVLLGAAFIIGGALLLTDTSGSSALYAEMVVASAVGLLGLVALVLFGTSGRWWLLPLGCALLTVGTLQALFNLTLNNFFTVWGITLLGIGGPFVGLYMRDSRRWGWLLPGLGLWVLGGVLFLIGLLLIDPPLSLGWLPTLTLWLAAGLFVVIFAGNVRAWWAFTLGYALWAVGAGLRLGGDAFVVWGLWAVALLFWLGYLRDDERSLRLWVAGALSIAGAIPLLVSRRPGYWLAIGVSVGAGLAWVADWLRRRGPGQASEGQYD